MPKRRPNVNKHKQQNPETARRVQVVHDMWVIGKPLAAIKAECSALWSVTPRQVHNYYLQVMATVREESAPVRAEAKARARRKLELAYRVGIETGKIAPAVSAARALAALDGVATERTEHSGPEGGPIPHVVMVKLDLSRLTDEELAQLEVIAAKLDDVKEPVAPVDKLP